MPLLRKVAVAKAVTGPATKGKPVAKVAVVAAATPGRRRR